MAFFCHFYYRLELYRILQAVLPSCWLVAKLSWWKRKERERGRNMGMTCEEWLRYSTELCHWTHCSGIPYRPFTKMSPSSHLCSQSADRRPTLSHHISAQMLEDLPPDKHNLLFQHFAITATRPSTCIWKETEAEIQTWQTSSQEGTQLHLIEVPGSPDRGRTDVYLEKNSPCCSPSS